jgi:hypothetical protein
VRSCAAQLSKDGDLNLKSVHHFVLDECDKMLEALGARPRRAARIAAARHTHGVRSDPRRRPPRAADMRADIQEIFKKTPHDKQVMMFSATLSKEIRPVCKKFMTDVRGGSVACHDLRARACVRACANEFGRLHSRVAVRSQWRFTWTTRRS